MRVNEAASDACTRTAVFCFFAVRLRGAVIPRRAPEHPADFSLKLRGSAIISILLITHTGNVEFALYGFLLFF